MKEELAALWLAYNEDCKVKEHEYFEFVIKNFGPMNYRRNKDNLPSFEGFMTWITEEVKKEIEVI